MILLSSDAQVCFSMAVDGLKPTHVPSSNTFLIRGVPFERLASWILFHNTEGTTMGIVDGCPDYQP
jgi:hypothetical protein